MPPSFRTLLSLIRSIVASLDTLLSVPSLILATVALVESSPAPSLHYPSYLAINMQEADQRSCQNLVQNSSTDLIINPQGSSSPSHQHIIPFCTHDNPVLFSSLAAPVMALYGHQSQVTAIAFSPDIHTHATAIDNTTSPAPSHSSKTVLASASFDNSIYLWDASSPNYQPLAHWPVAHKKAITSLAFLGPTHLVSSSADTTVALWDVEYQSRVKQFKGHASFVHCAATFYDPNPSQAALLSLYPQHYRDLYTHTHSLGGDSSTIVSVSEDKNLLVWDPRHPRKGPTITIPHSYPLYTCVMRSHHEVFVAGVQGVIDAWDLRILRPAVNNQNGNGNAVADSNTDGNHSYYKKLYTLQGHTDAITGIALNRDKTHLASNSADGRCLVWDVQPFISNNSYSASKSNISNHSQDRFVADLRGIVHSIDANLLRCAWIQHPSHRSDVVAAASADGTLWIWEAFTAKPLYRLPGHKGPVNDVQFHPKEPVIASAGADKTIYVGEIAL